ncbi:MAG: ATP synthase F1 subunit gamma [Planctomycetota bacterium]|nr:ATP synthase F1 subunit gamma [Planctomycetota bacterium]RLT08133.1 MAG: ATP synthase F1 subunit gamma [Planctomycetota bacterium]
MAKARAIIERRKAVQNIQKITRTMELIATARFKKALDRATEAEAYTRKIAELVQDLGGSQTDFQHPLLEERIEPKNAVLLSLTSNRGLAGGYNSNVLKQTVRTRQANDLGGIGTHLEVAGKRGINFLRFQGIRSEKTFTNFEDRPQYHEVEEIADRYMKLFLERKIDRVDVVYTKFISVARQEAVVSTLLPMSTKDVGQLETLGRSKTKTTETAIKSSSANVPYDYLPDAKSILEEIVPVSFKVRLFKCFLDAAVSEQISRMVAMKGATENANDMIKTLSRLYNRARQAQITRELSEIIGAVAALE